MEGKVCKHCCAGCYPHISGALWLQVVKLFSSLQYRDDSIFCKRKNGKKWNKKWRRNQSRLKHAIVGWVLVLWILFSNKKYIVKPGEWLFRMFDDGARRGNSVRCYIPRTIDTFKQRGRFLLVLSRENFQYFDLLKVSDTVVIRESSLWLTAGYCYLCPLMGSCYVPVEKKTLTFRRVQSIAVSRLLPYVRKLCRMEVLANSLAGRALRSWAVERNALYPTISALSATCPSCASVRKTPKTYFLCRSENSRET